MGDTVVASANQVEQWDDEFFMEYNREHKFAQYMGTSPSAVIQVKENLTKKKGDVVHMQLLTKLTGDGTTGSNTLEGNEEEMDNYGDEIQVDQIRHAVRFSIMEEVKTTIDLREGGRDLLRDWMANKVFNTTLDCLGATNVDGKTTYSASSAAQRNAWCTANEDRIMFGAAIGNYSATLATGFGTIDTTNDKLDSGIVSLARRRAKLADPAIRPIKLRNGEEIFLMFVPSYAMRDLKADTVIQNSWQNAMERGKDNPLFQGGDVMWDGVIVKEIEDIDLIAGVGDTASSVGPCYLCGAQALGIAWAQKTKTRTKEFDYDDKYGISIGEIRGIKKLVFNDKDHGVLTCFVSCTADA